jgi:16S rRNA (cytosine(1402)-N(4))-methyltransferase
MAVAPALPWRKASAETLHRRLLWPAWAGTLVVVACVAAGLRGLGPLLAFGLAAFAGAAALRQLAISAGAAKRSGVGMWRGLLGRSSGGMVVHIGVVLLAVGFAASSSYGHRAQFRLAPGESASLAGHTVTTVDVEATPQGSGGVVASPQRSGGVVDGILMDLGMSSMQVDSADRGFSFRNDGPLDMRMDPSQKLTAAEVVNSYAESDLVRVLRAYGEERHAPRIVRAIVAARRRSPLRTTGELAEIVERAYPAGPRGYHPARRTFQALRIEVNAELDALKRALEAVPQVLGADGRLVVISYHSLEDRLTKRTIAGFVGRGTSLPGLGAPPETGVLAELTPNAVLPSTAESQRNPRASSARLRAAVRRARAA